MSVGHVSADSADLTPPKPSADTLARITPADHAKMLHLAQTASVTRNHDVLWLGGRSKDLSQVHLDRHLPKKMSDGKNTFDPADTLPWHEIPEGYLMGKGIKYPQAHAYAWHKVELPRIKALGLDPKSYQQAFAHELKKIEPEKITHPPPNIDLRPYREAGTKAELKAMSPKAARARRLAGAEL